jgi:hypothetical protein
VISGELPRPSVFGSFPQKSFRGRYNEHTKFDEFVKTSKLLAAVIPALDNNTQGQAAAGIQGFQLLMDVGSIPV